MSERQTIGQGSMHADYNGFNFWIRCRPLQNTFKPRNLCRSKLIMRRVIQRDEINWSLDPVIIRFELVILRIIRQALLLQERRIEPVGELRDVIATVAHALHFVITNAEKDRDIPERLYLVLNEIVPTGIAVAFYRKFP